MANFVPALLKVEKFLTDLMANNVLAECLENKERG